QDIHQHVVGVYGDGAPHYSTVAKWYSEFKRGLESLEDDPQSGCPADVVTPETIAQVEALIMQDHHIKTDAIVTELDISHGSVLMIIHDRLGMSKLSARLVPRNLSAQDRHQWLESSRELLEIFYTEQANFLAQHLKAYLHGKRFSNNEELMEDTEAWLQEQSKDFYFAGIDGLKDKWSKCTEVKGSYIEK
uniref:Mos1 transposase HTH domain-containing protein n=1 Tax=Latimeria chalumnae TaxID=7897 RepID=H2ZWM8_LATCH